MNINKMYEEGKIPNNLSIFDSFLVGNRKVEDYNNILALISNNEYNIIMIDILSKLDKNNKIIYSYKETVDDSYIKFLQDKYNIKV